MINSMSCLFDQVLGPVGMDDELSVEDINLIQRLAAQRGGKKVAGAVKGLGEYVKE